MPQSRTFERRNFRPCACSQLMYVCICACCICIVGDDGGSAAAAKRARVNSKESAGKGDTGHRTRVRVPSIVNRSSGMIGSRDVGVNLRWGVSVCVCVRTAGLAET